MRGVDRSGLNYVLHLLLLIFISNDLVFHSINIDCFHVVVLNFLLMV